LEEEEREKHLNGVIGMKMKISEKNGRKMGGKLNGKGQRKGKVAQKGGNNALLSW
jgi:hypothetical protein